MRVVVVGASGQVGRALVERYVESGNEVLATQKSRPFERDGATVAHLDKVDAVSSRRTILDFRPHAVIDTGAMHNVDYCETHPAEAYAVNRDGTAALASAAQEAGASFVFVSTDFVFDGAKGEPYEESDPTRPISVYAESKLAGEAAALARCPGTVIVRPSVIYSWLARGLRRDSSSGKGLNFGTWLVEEVRNGRSVRIIRDQIASPTLAEDLAEGIVALERHGARGIYHVAGASSLNRYDFSVALIRRLGLDRSLVTPALTADLRQVAKRPPNSSLNSDRLYREAGHRTLDLTSALDRVAESYDRDASVADRSL